MVCKFVWEVGLNDFVSEIFLSRRLLVADDIIHEQISLTLKLRLK